VSGSQKQASVVISAYNEEPYLAAVLEALHSTANLARITVVDDGSVDSTSALVRCGQKKDPRLRLLRLPSNRGKGAAMVAGAEASPGDLIVFLDADLMGLKPANLLALIEPVAEGRGEMSLGIFRGGRFGTDLTQHLTPFLNGQRCLRWSLFRDAPDLAVCRSGAEVALSLHARRRKYRVVKVPLHGVTHVMKHEKHPFLEGELAHARMFGEIFRYLLSRKDSRHGGKS
jgi:glycosyltransferase involved in cell wall biosynthesis